MSERPSRPPMPRNNAAAGASASASVSAPASASPIPAMPVSVLVSQVLSLLPCSSAEWTPVAQVGAWFVRRTGHRFKEVHPQSIESFLQQHPQQFKLRAAANGHTQSVSRATDAGTADTSTPQGAGAASAAPAKTPSKAEAAKNAPAAAAAAPTSAASASSAAVSSASVKIPRKDENKKLAASPAASPPTAAAQSKKPASAAAAPKASAKAVAAPAVAAATPVSPARAVPAAGAVSVAAVARPPAAAPAEQPAPPTGQLQPRPSAAAPEPAALHAALKASPAAASSSASASAPLAVEPTPPSKHNPSSSSSAIPAAAAAAAIPAPLTIHPVKNRWARDGATAAPSSTPQSFAATMQSQMKDQQAASSSASSSQDARHQPLSSVASFSSVSFSSGANRPSGRAHLFDVVNRLTLSWQTSNHDQGRYCGPKQRVIDHIVAQHDFIAAVTHANNRTPVQWSVTDFERLFTVTNYRGFSSLVLPPMFEQLCDLLDQVSLFLASVPSQPFNTLFDISTELPAFLVDQCQPYVLVDAATGKETRGHNRLEKHRSAWTFRRYEDLRLGRLENHPTARSMFRVPADLVAIPAVRKADIIEAAASWLPSGKMSDLVARGKIGEGALLTAIIKQPLFRAKIKQAKPNPAQRLQHIAESFTHQHPLVMGTTDPPTPWRCDSCGADAAPEETTRFGCAECDVSVNVHPQCVARSPALLAMLPSELVQSLRDQFGPPSLSLAASSAPAVPDDRYLCLLISPRFDLILRMIKRHRYLALTFQQEYTAKKEPQLKIEVEARCDALVVQLHKRLASQLSPPEHLYRECTKKVRTLLMEMDFSSMDDDSDEPDAAAMDSGAPANASAAQQRAFRRRQRQIATVRSHLERVLKLVDAHGHPVPTQSPTIALHRLLVSATPLLIDVVSDRILFVTSPQVVRDAEQKRKAQLAESGEQESEAELESDEEEEKSVHAPRSHKTSIARSKAAARSVSSVVLEHEDGEALESSEDIVEEDPRPYSESTVRAHMHQLSAIVTPTGPSDTGALLFFTMVRQLQSHMWRAFCSLNPHVDDSAPPPSLLEWLSSQSIPLQAAVESWAHRRAGAKDGASGSSESAAPHLKPVYPASELCQFLMSCVTAMEGTAAWRQWEDAASAHLSSDESLRRSPVELILDTPAAQQRLNRAVQIHFAVSDISQLGHGALSAILESEGARFNAAHNNAPVLLVPLAQLLASSPQFWSPGRISAAAASLPVPVSELVSSRDLLVECLQPSVHHRSALSDVSAASVASSSALAEVSSADLHRQAIYALVAVPMLAEVAAATHWSLAFDKRLGRIELFVRANAAEIAEAVQGEQNRNDDGPALLMMQLSAGTMIRLDPRASLARLAHRDASADMCALQLVSLIALSTSFQQLDLELLAAACHTMLAQRCTASSVQAGVAFVLAMIGHVPEPLRISVCELMLPLAAVSFWPQREHGVEPQALLHAALLAEAQRETAPGPHLSMLHALGLQLPVQLWVDHFQASTRAHTISDPVHGITAALQQQSLEEPVVMETEANLDLSAASMELPPGTPQTVGDASSVSEGLTSTEPVSSSSTAVVALSDASSSSGPSLSPRSVIASIRLSRGVDEVFHGRDAASLAVDAAKNKLLHNALELLSKELYQSSTHWMLESLQNADDNDYAAAQLCPTLVFRLSPTDLTIVNNELGFREENVRGICGLGNTTKRGDPSAAVAAGDAASSASAPSRSRIGHKGIGFKSVYVVTDNPQVFSAGYSFQLGLQPDDETAAAAAGPKRADRNLGMIIPRQIEDADVPAIVTQLKQRYQAETVIRLPLKSMLIKDSKDKASMELVTSAGLSPWASLRHQLSELFEPTLLLFLQRVRCLVFEQVTSEASKSRASIPNTLELRRLSSASSDIVEIVESHSGLGVGDVSGTHTTHRFLVVTRTVEIPQAKRQAFRWEEAPRTTQLAFAFPLSSEAVFPLPIQPVFAFLPVRPYGFRFLIQADFLLASSRDSLVESAPRNQWLMEQIPHLMPSVLQHFQRHMQLRTPGVSLLTFFHSLPLSGSRGEGDFGCLRGAAAALLQATKALPCAQDDGGLWAQPKALFFTSQPIVRALLPSALLRQSIHHRAWLSALLERLPVSVKSALGMQEFRAEHVIELLRKACQAFQHNEDKRSAQDSNEAAVIDAALLGAAQHRAFIAPALQALRILLPSAADRSAELEKLRSLPVFALDNGSFVAMQPDRPILMRADVDEGAGSAVSDAITQGSSLSCRRVLEGSLQIVHADLLVESVPSQPTSSKSGAQLQTDHQQLVRKLLIELGVGTVDDHSLFQQAATKLKQLSLQPEDTWQQDGVREHARATLILSYLHFGSCAHPACQGLRKQLSSFALLEASSGSVQRIDTIRSRLILSQPWTESKLAGLVDRLRAALPNELAFETLSGCYLEESSPASASASSSSASPAAADSQSASSPRAAWLSFWRREFGLMELFQVTVNSEVMSVPALRQDPRCKLTPEVYQMADREPEIIVQDFHSPAMTRLLEVCSALPITSPLLPLAQIALDELLIALCDQWSTWMPLMSLRVRRNVTDFSARQSERDVTVNHPSTLINTLRNCAWIPSSRYRLAAVSPGAPRSLPPFLKPTSLYLADKHNQALMPLDTPFFHGQIAGPTDHRACLEAIGIELHVSALQIYHLLVSDWSMREGGLVSSLQRMRDVYAFLQQHHGESIEFESESTQSWKLRNAFALHLPDSHGMAGGQRIGDLFLESESRNVVWIPLPSDVPMHDTTTPVLGRFFSPHQFVLNDSRPEILNHVAFSPQWYQMRHLALFVTKQLYKSSNGKRSFWHVAQQDPYYEPLTMALIAYVQLCVKANAATDGHASQSHGLARDSELTDLGIPRCDPLLVRHLCSWRAYLSSLLATRYANDADMKEERGHVTVALRTGRLFPCYRLGDDSGVVHFVSLSDQPILVDDLDMAQRFADAGGPLASGDQTLYLLLFIGTDDKWGLDAMAHEPAQKLLWTEFGLRKLSQLCERKTIVEVEAALLVPLQQQLRAITRSMQRYLLSIMPMAYRAVSPQFPCLLASYRVVVCRELEVEWQVCGTRSPAQHCSVMHEPEQRRVCVHQRDLQMEEVRVLRDVLVEICSLVCDAVPESQRTSDLHGMLVEFAAALLACGRDPMQLEQQTTKLCRGAMLPAGEPLWSWMESREEAATARQDNAEDAPVARRIKGEQYSTRDLFGADAPAPTSLPVHDASRSASSPQPASSAPAPSAAASSAVAVVTPLHVAAALSIAPPTLPSPPSSSSSAPPDRDRDPNASVPEKSTDGFGHVAALSSSSSSNAAPGAGTTASSASNPQIDWTTSHGFMTDAAASGPAAPLPPLVSVPEAVVHLLRAAQSSGESAVSSGGLSLSLAERMAECAKRLPAPSSNGSFDCASDQLDSQVSTDVGWFGEALCYQILMHREAQRQLADPSSAPRAVLWLNQDSESGAPFDLQVGADLSNPATELIEVKSSIHGDKHTFEISAREVATALQFQHRYSIWRLTHAGNASLAQLQIRPNPAQAWHRKEIKVTMTL